MRVLPNSSPKSLVFNDVIYVAETILYSYPILACLKTFTFNAGALAAVTEIICYCYLTSSRIALGSTAQAHCTASLSIIWLVPTRLCNLRPNPP